MHSEQGIFRDLPPGTILFQLQGKLLEARVIERINRFLVRVSQGEVEFLCHLHDPGRLRELIFPGNRVLIRETNGSRTSCSVAAALIQDEWVITDSRFHHPIVRNFLKGAVRPEVKLGNHRIDFLVNDSLVEVKGATLLKDDIAMFPDAPTKRGREHIGLLRELKRNGKKVALVVLVLRKGARCFLPNSDTDPDFSEEFFQAVKEKMEIFIPKCWFDGRTIRYGGLIQVCSHE